ncbi:MAG: hypothetical protein M1140_01105 [Chloroflexi bacterium]|nr:hypothetical protein [Chloroflexota bacterium]
MSLHVGLNVIGIADREYLYDLDIVQLPVTNMRIPLSMCAIASSAVNGGLQMA